MTQLVVVILYKEEGEGGDDVGGRFDDGTICGLIKGDEETEEDDVVESFEYILRALSFRD